ncbi:uncharacterized protein LOC142560069 isoform X1 [Dermacentor variabilis]|uniref:uncharacterized protein LOC142560069 isoform X1 n=1 Tax=Dermacentor variabilis TaxID=34621 RepID=UPI003F5BFE95
MTSRSDRCSSDLRCDVGDDSVSALFLGAAPPAHTRRLEGFHEQRRVPYNSRYCEPYQQYACPPYEYLRPYSPSKANRAHWRATGSTWYLADSFPADINSGLLPTPSHYTELFPQNLDSEPFDAPGETERLMKIHFLAEEIVARDAAMLCNRDVVSREVDGESCSTTEPTNPAKPSVASLSLKTLAESSLMPLAEAAGHSVRVSVQASPPARATSAESSKQPPAEPAETSPPMPDRPATVADNSNGSPGEHCSSAAPISSQSGGRRKKAIPRKSPSADDPNFKGAVVHMRLQLVNGMPKLKMEHYFNNMQRRGVLRPDYAEISESEDDFEYARKEDVEHQDKQCASCATKLTPLWRDAEDGTPLCNACGIRYKKYKVRCTRCWHIPRKNDNTRSDCKECGGTLRFVVRKSCG